MWSIIYGLEQFSEWNGSEMGWIAVANISAGIEHLLWRERVSDALLIVTSNVISMPPCLLHPSQYCNLGIMRKLQSHFRRNHSFIWSSWLHHLLPQLCLICLLLLHHNLGVCDYPVHLRYNHCPLPVNPYVWQLTFSNDVYSSRYEIEKVIVAALKESMK